MIDFINSTLRFATPLIFASMGGLLCERAGIATICIEGIILVSAFTSAAFDYYSSSPWLSLGAALLVGGVFMLLHAFLTVRVKSDPIISAITVNLLASGMTPLLMKLLFSNSTNTPSLPQENRFLPVFIPFLSSFPIIRHFSNHLSLVYLAILLPFVIQITLTNTRWGLRLIAAGDGPEALVTSGVSLNHTRFVALFLGGCLMAFSGSYLAIGHSSQFIRDMSAGRGFIALAAIIIGKWQPIPTLVACVFFGFTDALQIELQSSEMLNLILPAQFIQSLPYVISLVVLVFAMGRAKPPLAIGQTSR